MADFQDTTVESSSDREMPVKTCKFNENIQDNENNIVELLTKDERFDNDRSNYYRHLKGLKKKRKNKSQKKYKSSNRFNEFYGASTIDLPIMDMDEKEFNGHNRLFIANLPLNVTEEDLKNLFKSFGVISHIFINRDKKTTFAFVTLDYYINAQKAMRKLDGSLYLDKKLKVHFSNRFYAIKVSNLPPTVTNELLHHAFSHWGEVERAIVYTDEKRKPLGYGIVEFARKRSQMKAIKDCTNKCFFLTASLRPVIVESYESLLENDGLSEKKLEWKSGEYLRDREKGPWFAKINSPEHELGQKWKRLREKYKEKKLAIKRELESEEQKLLSQIDFEKYKCETEMLKKLVEEREMFWQRQMKEQKNNYLEGQRMTTEVDPNRNEEVNFFERSRENWNNRDYYEQRRSFQNTGEYQANFSREYQEITPRQYQEDETRGYHMDTFRTYEADNFAVPREGNFREYPMRTSNEYETNPLRTYPTDSSTWDRQNLNKNIAASRIDPNKYSYNRGVSQIEDRKETFKRKWNENVELEVVREPFEVVRSNDQWEEAESRYKKTPRSWTNSWEDDVPVKKKL